MNLDGKRREEIERFLEQHGLYRLGYIDLDLVNQAFQHPSYVSERGGFITENNQRLEFLGDSILGLLISSYLYRTFPDSQEGDLTRMRSVVVCETALFLAAKQLNLGAMLQLGKGERRTVGADRSSNLADCFEALLGALFLSNGHMDRLEHFVVGVLQDSIEIAARREFGDYKSRLQEWTQKEWSKPVVYRIVDECGPDHNKTFWAGVYSNGQEIARDQGRTKQEAEQRAARLALLTIQDERVRKRGDLEIDG
jgi:ribonuclease-3